MTTLGPAAEAVFSLQHMGTRAEPAFREWRKQVTARLRSGQLDRGVVEALRRSPDLTWLLSQGEGAISGERAEVSGLSRSDIRTAMERYAEVSVSPYWEQMLAHLTTVRERLMERSSGNNESLLASLHPQISWNGQYLEMQNGENRHFDLTGRGLLLAPSVFLGARPAVLLRNVAGTSALPVLVFSVSSQNGVKETLWNTHARDMEALDALMGRTRAQLLRLTLAGGTTSELARHVGTSAAAVSQHTGVLRNAGLIRSERDRNTVTHRITDLGRAVLNGMGPALAVPTQTRRVPDAADTMVPRARQRFPRQRIAAPVHMAYQAS
ncbi:ArsR/SmtB family transcription factor [Streptomyces violaceorubidus]|uniref:Winged helix-turn-helix domain-containing protein n=1 Tax=Streptomyces violaceorubidus TaxID=284042 RepID=A0ABV1T2S1_9ACTN|nr:winged helix-turn-helix domain-containing protein [Streptomyces violaceorubidus]